jgi:membrane fusion protein (multidrug efflux system)
LPVENLKPGTLYPILKMKNLSLLLVLALVVTACGKNEKTQPGAAGSAPGSKTGLTVTSVEGFVAKPSVLTERVTASGTLVPSEETELHPEASGRVVALHLPEGRSVRKGEVLLKIFDEDLKTQLRKLDTQLKQAEITERRLAELLQVKGVSQQEYDLASLSVQTIKSDIELVRINIEKTELRAPYDGIIGLRRLSLGAYVTPATPVTTLRTASALKLDFSVPEKYSPLIHVGQSIDFTVQGNATAHTATVLATEQTIAAESRNLVVRAAVRDSRGLLPGAFAEVNLALGNKMQALMVPNQAIIPRAREKKVILCKGGKAQFVTVKTGVRQAELIEIIDGIQPGDTICTTGILFLRPNDGVKFSKIN